MSVWYFKSSVVSIWLGYFESEDQFAKYMKKKFKKDYDIGKPKGVWWDIFEEEILPIEELIGRCEYSKSYIDKIIKSSSRLDLKKFNACIVRFNMASDKIFDVKDKSMKFICTAQYDSSREALSSEEDSEIDFEVEGKVSVWAGEFANESEFKDYFEEAFHEDEYQSMFAEDFEIDFYDHDYLELLTSPEFNLDSIENMINKASYSKSFSKQAVKAAGKKDCIQINTLLILFDFDYSLLIEDGFEGGSRVPRFKFIGTFNYKQE